METFLHKAVEEVLHMHGSSGIVAIRVILNTVLLLTLARIRYLAALSSFWRYNTNNTFNTSIDVFYKNVRYQIFMIVRYLTIDYVVSSLLRSIRI